MGLVLVRMSWRKKGREKGGKEKNQRENEKTTSCNTYTTTRRRRSYLPVTSKTVFNLDERLLRISRRSDGRSIYHERRAKLEL